MPDHDALTLSQICAAYQQGWDDCLNAMAYHVGGRIMPAQPTELEILRYGPGGRAHAGDPRPGDFPGLATMKAVAA